MLPRDQQAVACSRSADRVGVLGQVPQRAVPTRVEHRVIVTRADRAQHHRGVQRGRRLRVGLEPAGVLRLWHCDREGRYSLYSDGVTDRNYLRGVRADANGKVRFASIFPACYTGRGPHIHVEIYPTHQASITDASKVMATSQVAVPRPRSTAMFTKILLSWRIAGMSGQRHCHRDTVLATLSQAPQHAMRMTAPSAPTNATRAYPTCPAAAGPFLHPLRPTPPHRPAWRHCGPAKPGHLNTAWDSEPFVVLGDTTRVASDGGFGKSHTPCRWPADASGRLRTPQAYLVGDGGRCLSSPRRGPVGAAWRW